MNVGLRIAAAGKKTINTKMAGGGSSVVSAACVCPDGEWGSDWGVCWHPASAFDGVVRFEHDGCERHEATAERIIPGLDGM